MGANKNIATSLEIRIRDFEKKVSAVANRIEAGKLFRIETADIYKQFMEEEKLNTALHDKFVRLCNQLSEKIITMENIAAKLKK